MFARWKLKRIFQIGAATYEHAQYVNRVKGMDMVYYLRERRNITSVVNQHFLEAAKRNKAFVRNNYLKRKRFGLMP